MKYSEDYLLEDSGMQKYYSPIQFRCYSPERTRKNFQNVKSEHLVRHLSSSFPLKTFKFALEMKKIIDN